MITLTTDKGLVRLESWDDVLSRPGFVTDLNPRKVKLERIIGSYALFPFLPCGLSSCHRSHGKGYLVATSDGRETNIGKDCGKRHFDVVFERLSKAFDRDLRNKERRETLVALQHRIPAIEERIAALMDGTCGARWINKYAGRLRDPVKGPPTTVIAIVDGLVRRRSGALTRSRVATAEDLDHMRAVGQRIQPGDNYIEEVVGQLDGVATLYKENDLRRLLVLGMANLATVKALDVDGAKEKTLRDLAKWNESIEPTLAQAAEVIALGRRLLTQENLRRLLPMLSNKEDRQGFNAFLAELPEGEMLEA
ncbi:hypothetical protein KK141_21345 [Dyella sp. LX-66]|uniref:hypothetical protein n=1 Tax=unclassified Dyella TaxID=2634549 RepID=UPI001BE04026|nr:MULTISPECIES: hypothetical protein [unclassified Dyella]MBT2119679.1 hypothetical protein [Dyella sp. LX-1]MBT2142106.1 hypothetical protein [Dyella sp. LX-66]